MAHAANSAATLRDPGVPLRHGALRRGDLRPRPVPGGPGRPRAGAALELSSYVAAVKRFEPGESAGYGRRWTRRASRTWVATLPIGYGDGWRRALTNNCDVLIGGARRPLVGTVSMDNVTVDLGPETDVAVGDEAVLIGEPGGRAHPLRGGGAGGSGRSTTRSPAASSPRCRVRAVIDALSGWLVRRRRSADRAAAGGAVRDRDIVVAAATRRQAARERGRGGGGAGPVFPLSEEFGAWRVLSRDRAVTYDFSPLQGATIEEDLAQRDFTVNAMAEPLGGGDLIDPHGGERDLRDGRAARAGPAGLRGRPAARRCAWCASRPSWASQPEPETERLTTGRRAAADRALARARVRRAAARGRGRVRWRAGAGRPPGRARRGAARADAARGHRAEPLPPPRRVRPHARGAAR